MNQTAAQKDDAPPGDGRFASIPQLQAIEGLLDDMQKAASADKPSETASALLNIGETVLEIWIRAHQKLPTSANKEGFRLLALHRQGSRGEPSFNACRETCRELVYYYNLIVAEPAHPLVASRVRMMTMVAKHLCLFVSGKLQVAGLGDFCCSSKPLREGGV